MATAVATSLVIIVLNSAAGFVAHVGDTTIDVGIAATFTITAIAGPLTAARLASRLPAPDCAGGSRTWSSASPPTDHPDTGDTAC